MATAWEKWRNVCTRVVFEKLDFVDDADVKATLSLLPLDAVRAFSSTHCKVRSKKRAAEIASEMLSNDSEKGKHSSSSSKQAKTNAGTNSKDGGATSSAKAKEGTAQSIGAVDTLAVEQLAEITARTNRWNRHLLMTINDVLFGSFTEAIHFSRTPLDHLGNFLTLSDVKKDYGAKGAILCQLTCFKAKEIAEEFDDVLCALAFES